MLEITFLDQCNNLFYVYEMKFPFFFVTFIHENKINIEKVSVLRVNI